MRFIVTGGAGFIGSNVVAALNQRGQRDILVVDNLDHPGKEHNLAELAYRDYLDKRDFRKQFLSGAIDKADTVFHMGACSSTTETDEEYMTDNNFVYTRQLCEWCLGAGSRFIYASSAATYGDGAHGYSDDPGTITALEPLNLYGNSKHLFDLWALDNGVLDRIAGLKYFNVYGPREDHKGHMRSLANKAYDQIVETGEIELFKSYRPQYRDGEQERDFVYVKDAVEVTLFFHDNSEISGIYNCGSGCARTWLELAQALFAAMGREPRVRFVEMPDEIQPNYQYHTRADVSNLRRAGYAAPFMTVEEGVADYVRNYLSSPGIRP